MFYYNIQKSRDLTGDLNLDLKKGIGILGGSTIDSKNKWSSHHDDKNEMFGRVEDFFVILGYEVENLCLKESTDDLSGRDSEL